MESVIASFRYSFLRSPFAPTSIRNSLLHDLSTARNSARSFPSKLSQSNQRARENKNETVHGSLTSVVGRSESDSLLQESQSHREKRIGKYTSEIAKDKRRCELNYSRRKDKNLVGVDKQTVIGALGGRCTRERRKR